MTNTEIERATEDLIRRVADNGRVTCDDMWAARTLLADPSLDFERGDVLTVATLLAIADGDWPEARAYLTAATSDDQCYHHGMHAQAESRIFGYLDARGMA